MSLPIAPSMILLIVVGVFALIGACKGASRGFARQIVRFLTIAASVVLAFVLTKALADGVNGFLAGKTIPEILSCEDFGTLNFIFKPLVGSLAALLDSTLTPDQLRLIFSFDTETVTEVVAIPMSLIVLPLLFVILFVALSAVLLIVHAIVSGILGFSKRRNTAFTRFLGFLLGAVQGAIVAGILLIPLAGLTGLVGDAAESMKANDPDSDTTKAVVEIYDDYVAEAESGAVLQIVHNFGGDYVSSELAKTTVEGEQVDMADETRTVVDIYSKIAPLTTGEADLMNLTPDQQKAIRSILSDVNASRYVRSLLSGAVRGAAKAVDTGAITIQMDPPFGDFIVSLIKVFTTSNADNIAIDLNTIFNVYFTLCDAGVLSSMGEDSDALTDALTKTNAEGKTIITLVVDELNANERTKCVTKMLTDMSFAILMQQTGADEDVMEMIGTVKDGLTATLSITEDSYATHEEYVGAVADSIDATLKDVGVELDADILNSVAETYAENFAGKAEITDEDLTQFILSYYDAYAEDLSELPGLE